MIFIIKINDIFDFEENKQKLKIPYGIINAIYGDLKVINELENNKNSYILILKSNEFKEIKTIDNLSKSDYENKFIVFIDENIYIEKYLYLLDNGESGIIIYVIHNFHDNTRGKKQRLIITDRVYEEVDIKVISKIYEILKDFNGQDEQPTIQTWYLTKIDENKIKLVCFQEEPFNYERCYIDNVKIKEDRDLITIKNIDEKNRYTILIMEGDY